MEASLSPQHTANTSPISEHSTAAMGVVFQDAYSECQTGLTEPQREAAILRAGKSVEHHMAENKKALFDFDVSNNFADKGLADRHRLMAEEAARLMAALIRGRSAAEGSIE